MYHQIFLKQIIIITYIKGTIHLQILDRKQTWNSIFKTMELLLETHSIVRHYAIIESCLKEMYIEYTNRRPLAFQEESVNFLPCTIRTNVIRYSIPRSPTTLRRQSGGKSAGTFIYLQYPQLFYLMIYCICRNRFRRLISSTLLQKPRFCTRSS